MVNPKGAWEEVEQNTVAEYLLYYSGPQDLIMNDDGYIASSSWVCVLVLLEYMDGKFGCFLCFVQFLSGHTRIGCFMIVVVMVFCFSPTKTMYCSKYLFSP